MSITNNQNDQAEPIIFDDNVKKEAITIAAYHYIKQLYEHGLLSEKELNKIKEKYNICID